MQNNPHFPFLPEDSWKKKNVEKSRLAILAKLESETRKRIFSLITDYETYNYTTSAINNRFYYMILAMIAT